MQTDLRYPEGLIASQQEIAEPLKKNLTLGLVKHKTYPDYSTYRGKAYRATLKFHSFRIIYIDDIINWLTEQAVEAKTWAEGGEMLELKIWAEESSWYNLPTYIWTIEWYFYIRGEKEGAVLLAAPAVAAIIYAVVIVIGIFALVWLVKSVTELVWGAKNGKNGLIPSITTLLLIGGGLYLAIMLLTPEFKKRRKRK